VAWKPSEEGGSSRQKSKTLVQPNSKFKRFAYPQSGTGVAANDPVTCGRLWLWRRQLESLEQAKQGYVPPMEFSATIFSLLGDKDQQKIEPPPTRAPFRKSNESPNLGTVNGVTTFDKRTANL
jgi:hypothetical protein